MSPARFRLFRGLLQRRDTRFDLFDLNRILRMSEDAIRSAQACRGRHAGIDHEFEHGRCRGTRSLMQTRHGLPKCRAFRFSVRSLEGWLFQPAIQRSRWNICGVSSVFDAWRRQERQNRRFLSGPKFFGDSWNP